MSTFGDRRLFWAGVVAVTAGVVLHLPMYAEARAMGYRMVGMPIDLTMSLGMVLILVGLVASVWGLIPRDHHRSPSSGTPLRVRALDEVPIRGAHVALMLVMAAAVTIDVMKPATLSFVLPGMTQEYGLKSPLHPTGHIPAALLPLSGILGTVIGSFLWGWMGDRLGRRPSILIAAMTFIATSICGSMPSYALNMLMCFVMGLGVGGMLPIMFTIMAETIPARHRGWLLVLIGGDVAGAYIITSWLAASLVPTYSWRILWLIGLPTGVLLILLNRWIPESPRFLLAHGRSEEASAIMRRYGAAVVHDEAPRPLPAADLRLTRPPFLGPTILVVLLGLGIGLVSFGFQLWIPSNLQKLGMTQADASRMLRNSALIGFPLNFLVAWLYGFVSSKRTLMALSALTALSLFGFVMVGDGVVANRALLYALLVMPIWGISSVVAVLSAYSAEIFPTALRSRGTGLAAGLSKAGGLLIIALVALAVAPPSIAGTALIGAIPMALAALAVAVFGRETHKRELESITAEQLEGRLVTRAS
ncbi:MAG: MFS transporter [Gemmatimonadaceae bacterium]|nr:MFS transporter [Gemmatimonadaceae bacterium]NUQ93119.1 MFS transporter [Gemmatimonadaceae bacterium]NUR19098.1 MFS transporter [Gemmatimonadaceae bacterium]NUS96401.1 MFS transporter [Gemmatimonadaceae bacterium]